MDRQAQQPSPQARKSKELHRESAAKAVVSDVHHLQVPEVCVRDIHSRQIPIVPLSSERNAWLACEQVALQEDFREAERVTLSTQE